jgi:hypothetical protein
MCIQASLLLDRTVAALIASSEKFVFVVDSWDSPLQKSFMFDEYKPVYLDFLKTLFSQQPFVDFSYITGVQPMPSSCDSFHQFIFGRDKPFCAYFGFTQAEVSELRSRYAKFFKETGMRQMMSLQNLKRYYDGYKTPLGANMYNPGDVASVLTNNCVAHFWAKTGGTKKILNYLSLDFPAISAVVASLVKDKNVVLEQAKASLDELVFGLKSPKTRDEILSMMVAKGLLTYQDKTVSIPNMETRMDFITAIENDERFGALHKLVSKTYSILDAMLSKDSDALGALLNQASVEESPFLSCDNEAELANIISMASLLALDKYELKRLNPNGKGFADVLFTPTDKQEQTLVVELRIARDADLVLRQLKGNYQESFLAKRYSRPVLLVAIAYDRETKTHSCKIEDLALLSHNRQRRWIDRGDS